MGNSPTSSLYQTTLKLLVDHASECVRTGIKQNPELDRHLSMCSLQQLGMMIDQVIESHYPPETRNMESYCKDIKIEIKKTERTPLNSKNHDGVEFRLLRAKAITMIILTTECENRLIKDRIIG